MQRRKRYSLVAIGLVLVLAGLFSLLFKEDAKQAHAQSQAPSPVQTQAAQTGSGQGAIDPLKAPIASATPAPTCIAAADVIDSPSMPNFNELYGVGAVSASDAWAVGAYYRSNFGTSYTLIQHWDGSGWTDVHSPNPSPTPNFGGVNALRSVAAISANDVWAVGSGGGRNYSLALIEHWDGSQWSIVPGPAPDPQRAYNLYGVTALSANDIWAVGDFYSFYPSTGAGAYILHYDGTAWTEVPNSIEATLYSVDAVSATDIWAVGGGLNGTPAAPASAHYDGTTWTPAVVPNPSPYNADLTGVAAVATNDVWAVGKYQSTGGNALLTLIEHWDGTQWVAVPTQGEPGATYQLTGIVAISASDIWASGWTAPAGNGTSLSRPLTMHYNGNEWIGVETPGIQQSLFSNKLYGIGALDNRNVWAVGSVGSTYTLAEKWTGSAWQVTPSTSPGLGTNVLSKVAALSPSDIWAVGYYATTVSSAYMPNKTLVEHWNGSRWSIVPSPNQGETPTMLRDVAAVSANDIWAVGVVGVGPEYLTYVIHWNGSQWSQVTSPNPYVGWDNSLNSIVAISANNIYAVGSAGVNSAPFIIHWDGSQWTQVTDTGTTNVGILYGITATGPNDIWAVGLDDFYPNPIHPLILHYDGAAWSRIPMESIRGLLYSVTAISPTDVWAVGDYSPDGQRNNSLTLHWNGTSWTQVPSPNYTVALNTYLVGVSAKASNDVWAVGYYYYTTGVNANTFLIHWDGTSWTPVPTVDTGIISTRLQGVVALPQGGVWMVGSAFHLTPDQAPVDQTLVEYIGRFSDVHPYDYYSTAVDYLASHGIISGYSDCTFRPGADTTRGQICKIIVQAEGWPINLGRGPHFDDVDTRNAFYPYIQTAWEHGIISGYRDGTFRPNNNITRSQLSKVMVLAEGWITDTTGGPHFSDVPDGSPFYAYVETAYHHSIISGYADGTFRPGANATRGQISKIVYNAILAR